MHGYGIGHSSPIASSRRCNSCEDHNGCSRVVYKFGVYGHPIVGIGCTATKRRIGDIEGRTSTSLGGACTNYQWNWTCREDWDWYGIGGTSVTTWRSFLWEGFLYTWLAIYQWIYRASKAWSGSKQTKCTWIERPIGRTNTPIILNSWVNGFMVKEMKVLWKRLHARNEKNKKHSYNP